MNAKRIGVWAAGTIGGLVLLLALCIGGLYLWLGMSLPQISGTATLPGISGDIVIARDKAGVPHIVAKSVDDAFFAIGFAQAQDRIFQMDMLRRFGEGTLSEIAGRQTVGRDAFMRTLGIRRAAARQLANLTPPVRRSLDDFAAGVNAYIRFHHGARFPLYYFVPGPENWRPLDTLVVEKLVTLYLTRNLQSEILRAELAKRLTAEELHELFPAYPGQGLVTLADTKAALNILPLERLRALIPPDFGRINASNNWVLDGAHTASGMPILENDPHLTYASPAIWYLAVIKAPGLWLAGGMMPGIPFVAVGHNGRAGWGMTETGGDVEDLFIERVDPADRQRYLAPGGSLAFKTHKEIIHVKGGKDVALTVRETRHGPVISDLAQDDGMRVRAGGIGERDPAALV
jgi:penicillin G amidase